GGRWDSGPSSPSKPQPHVGGTSDERVPPTAISRALDVEPRQAVTSPAANRRGDDRAFVRERAIEVLPGRFVENALHGIADRVRRVLGDDAIDARACAKRRDDL